MIWVLGLAFSNNLVLCNDRASVILHDRDTGRGWHNWPQVFAHSDRMIMHIPETEETARHKLVWLDIVFWTDGKEGAVQIGDRTKLLICPVSFGGEFA